jgi:hypothetical protein
MVDGRMEGTLTHRSTTTDEREYPPAPLYNTPPDTRTYPLTPKGQLQTDELYVQYPPLTSSPLPPSRFGSLRVV